MATHVRPGSERRHALRVPVHGHAVLHGEGAVACGVIRNLSLGGALIGVATPTKVGCADRLGVGLWLPATRQLDLRAHAIRVEPRDGGVEIALGFASVPPDTEDAIDEAVITAFVSAQRRRVLVIDDVETRRTDIADALRGLAMTPLTPHTPLDAIRLLADGGQRVDVCAVAPRFADLGGDTIATVLRDSFPWLRIVSIHDDVAVVAREAAAAWRDVEA